MDRHPAAHNTAYTDTITVPVGEFFPSCSSFEHSASSPGYIYCSPLITEPLYIFPFDSYFFGKRQCHPIFICPWHFIVARNSPVHYRKIMALLLCCLPAFLLYAPVLGKEPRDLVLSPDIGLVLEEAETQWGQETSRRSFAPTNCRRRPRNQNCPSSRVIKVVSPAKQQLCFPRLSRCC